MSKLPYDWDVIKINYCQKHILYWITDCPQCIHDSYTNGEQGYHKLPTPDSKEYQELREKADGILLEVFNDGFIYGELGRGKDDYESIGDKADRVLALLGGKE